MISKVSGLVQIREDTVPLKLMWKAIDQEKLMEIPLTNLQRLQTTPESSPKMVLKLFYQIPPDPATKDIKLSFNNRQTMNSVKEALQTIIARQKTVIKDDTASKTNLPAPETKLKEGTATPQPENPLDFLNPLLLKDSLLLKNHQLQQKLLLEDKELRNVFTHSVIKFKLSPMMFWQGRVGQLRTFALTISQHRGPYNVLSTIKPVATSDNQVNVNVTRDTINEIFDTYPIVKRAFLELVPAKLNEGEFWSRFFNSKLFRRLRGDRVNTTSTRGDIVLDNYLDESYHVGKGGDNGDSGATGAKPEQPESLAIDPQHHVNKFIDLYGNEEDNSQKLGPAPDFTMKFSDEDVEQRSQTGKQRENEMVILMKNMNKLSGKMIDMKASNEQESALQELRRHEQELDLADLNDNDDLQYIQLDLDPASARLRHFQEKQPTKEEPVDLAKVSGFLADSVFTASEKGSDLSETYREKTEEISKAALDVNLLVKFNFRTFRLLNNIKDSSSNRGGGENALPASFVQELITYNITIVEFLLHFWGLFLGSGNAVQLKKLFASLRNCQTALEGLKTKIVDHLKQLPPAQNNPKLLDKLLKDLDTCVGPMTAGLEKATSEYVAAVRSQVNENGKRPLEP